MIFNWVMRVDLRIDSFYYVFMCKLNPVLNDKRFNTGRVI